MQKPVTATLAQPWERRGRGFGWGEEDRGGRQVGREASGKGRGAGGRAGDWDETGGSLERARITADGTQQDGRRPQSQLGGRPIAPWVMTRRGDPLRSIIFVSWQGGP